MAGPRCCKEYLCAERLALTASEEISFNIMSAGRQTASIETLSNPCHALSEGAELHKHLSDCRFAAAESFNLRLICFRHTDLWVSRKASTLRITRGPRCDGKAAACNGFMPPPDLGPPMAKHVQQATPHASSLLFAALQLTHRGTRCTCALHADASRPAHGRPLSVCC